MKRETVFTIAAIGLLSSVESHYFANLINRFERREAFGHGAQNSI